MYAGVPMIVPVTVSGWLRCPPSEWLSASSGSSGVRCSGSDESSARARPKSVTRARPSLPMSTLSGLKSRWIMPAACAAQSPRPASRKIGKTSRHGRRSLRIHRFTVVPSTSSMAR